MKQSDAVQGRLRFKCPVQGCDVRQRFLSLSRHMVLFHAWRHVQIDDWRDTLTEADAVGMHDRSSSSEHRKKTTPPAAKTRQERPTTPNRFEIARGFTLGVILQSRVS